MLHNFFFPVKVIQCSRTTHNKCIGHFGQAVSIGSVTQVLIKFLYMASKWHMTTMKIIDYKIAYNIMLDGLGY